MSDQLALPTADAVETFVASLRQRSVPLNTIKSYAHDLRLFVQAVPADLTIVTPEQIQTFLTSDEHHSAATRRRRYSTLCTFYHCLLRHGVADTNPMDRLDPIEQESRESRPLSPLQWAHIHLNGSYHFTDVELEGDFRPLREYHGSRARLAPCLESVERDAGLLQEEEDVLPLQLSLLGEDEKDL